MVIRRSSSKRERTRSLLPSSTTFLDGPHGGRLPDPCEFFQERVYHSRMILLDGTWSPNPRVSVALFSEGEAPKRNRSRMTTPLTHRQRTGRGRVLMTLTLVTGLQNLKIGKGAIQGCTKKWQTPRGDKRKRRMVWLKLIDQPSYEHSMSC